MFYGNPTLRLLLVFEIFHLLRPISAQRRTKNKQDFQSDSRFMT